MEPCTVRGANKIGRKMAEMLNPGARIHFSESKQTKTKQNTHTETTITTQPSCSYILDSLVNLLLKFQRQKTISAFSVLVLKKYSVTDK